MRYPEYIVRRETSILGWKWSLSAAAPFVSHQCSGGWRQSGTWHHHRHHAGDVVVAYKEYGREDLFTKHGFRSFFNKSAKDLLQLDIFNFTAAW